MTMCYRDEHGFIVDNVSIIPRMTPFSAPISSLSMSEIKELRYAFEDRVTNDV